MGKKLAIKLFVRSNKCMNWMAQGTGVNSLHFFSQPAYKINATIDTLRKKQQNTKQINYIF